jgi:hypothetical protein
MAAGYRSYAFRWFTGYSAGAAAPSAPELWTRPGTVTSTYTQEQTLSNSWVPSGTVTSTYTRTGTTTDPWTQPGTLGSTWTKEQS